MRIKTNDFHLHWLNKYGGENNIINAARAGVELGLKVLIAIDIEVDHKCEACYLLGIKYKDELLSLASRKEDIFKALREWEDVRV